MFGQTESMCKRAEILFSAARVRLLERAEYRAVKLLLRNYYTLIWEFPFQSNSTTEANAALCFSARERYVLIRALHWYRLVQVSKMGLPVYTLPVRVSSLGLRDMAITCGEKLYCFTLRSIIYSDVSQIAHLTATISVIRDTAVLSFPRFRRIA